MKKWMTIMGALAFALSLAGCGETAEPKGETDASEKGELTLDELFAKTIAAAEEVESFHVATMINKTLDRESEMDMKLKIDSLTDMTLNPLAFHQIGETSFGTVDIQDIPGAKTEMYYTAEGWYHYEQMGDTWIKIPMVDMEELQRSLNTDYQSEDLSGQLEQLAEYQDDFSFEQTGNEFILTLDAEGKKYRKLLYMNMEEMVDENDVESRDMLEGMTIDKIFYEIFIDKETMLPNTINISMDYEMEGLGESMKITGDVQSEYSNYNGIDAITIPADVLENAEDLIDY